MAEKVERVSQGEGHGGPARRYSWPPFEKGNLKGVRHGAYSEQLIAPRAAEIAAELKAVVPAYSESDRAMVENLARVQARIERCEAAFAAIDEASDNAVSAFLTEKLDRLRADYVRWLGMSLRFADALGLHPKSRFELGLTYAQSQVARPKVEEMERLEAQLDSLPIQERVRFWAKVGEAEALLPEVPDD